MSKEVSTVARAKYRMIAIDLDGTLLCGNGTVTPRAKAAIHRALNAGMLVCFATGRNWTESRTVIDAVEHYGSAVFVGGAMVIDTKQRVTLHRTMMQPRLAAQVCAALEEMGHAAMALQDTGSAGVDYLITDGVELNESTRHWMRITSATVHRIKKLGEHPHEHTIRVGIVAAPERVRKAKVVLEERFNGLILTQAIFVPTANVEVLEIFDPAVNKWEGVLHVARRHGITREQIVAIGDDVNDVPMIREAGLGVAMGNAKPEVLAIAKRVIGKNTEEGLAAFLDELVDQHAVEPMHEEDESTNDEDIDTGE